MIASRWPQVGDEAIELRHGTYAPDAVGQVVRVKAITQTLVITSDGGKYNREGRFPVHEGRQSARKLVPTSDDRVLCVRGRELLEQVAQVAQNLARVDRKDPMDFVGAFAQIISTAASARNDFVRLTAAASKAEQESDR